MRKLSIFSALVVATLACLASQPVAAYALDDLISVDDPGSALFFEFCLVGTPNSDPAEIAQLDLGMAVSINGSQVLFEFVNASPIASVITDIYFDDSTSRGGSPLMDSGTVFDTAGSNVSFLVGPGAPPNLPSGSNLDPDFVANTALSAHATNPSSQDGVNDGENLVLAYDYLVSPELVAEALLDGTLRVGLHVQAIGQGGQSDAFIACPLDVPPPPTTPQDPVPEPATLVLLGMGASGLVLRKRFVV